MDSQQKNEQNEKQESTMESSSVAELQNENVAVGEKRIITNSTILLLEDSTSDKLPDYVNKILSKMINPSINKLSDAELLSILIYCIGLETGFVSTSTLDNIKRNYDFNVFWGYTFNSNNIKILCSLENNDNFHINDDNILKYSIKLFNYSDIECVLLHIISGDYLIITLTPQNKNLSGKSYCLSISRYIYSMKKLNLSLRFHNLKELSSIIKENIFIPIRNSLIEYESNFYYPSLCGIPPEIFVLILKNLSYNDIERLSNVCWKLRNICEEYLSKYYIPE